jgi:hypothetical protein
MTMVCCRCVLNLKGVRHCERSEAIHKYGMKHDVIRLKLMTLIPALRDSMEIEL